MTVDLGIALVRVVGEVASPLLEAGTPEGVVRLLGAAGWVETGALDVEGAAEALSGLTEEIKELLADPPTDLLDVATAVGRVAEPAISLASALAADPNVPGEVANDVADVLLSQCLARLGPLMPVLELLGAVEEFEVPQLAAGGWRRRPHRRRRLRLDRLSPLLQDPGAWLRDLAADPERLAATMWPVVVDAVDSFGWGATTGDTDPADVNAAQLRRILVIDIPISRIAAIYTRLAMGLERDPVLGLQAYVAAAPGLQWAGQRGNWSASVSLPGPQLMVLNRGGLTVDGGPGDITVQAGYLSSEEPALRFGSDDGMQLAVAELALSVALKTTSGLEVDGTAAVTGLRLTLQPKDGFLSTLLGPGPANVDADLMLNISSRNGLSFEGSRAPRLLLAGKRVIGPVEVLDLTIEILLQGGLGVELTAGVVARLGPLTVRVDRFGVQARLDEHGPVGVPLPLKVGLRPPAGIGALVASGPLTGGGYLFCDWDKGEYAGVMQLQFKALSLTAIGLINTKLPSGRPGWSFLVLIAVEFPGLPLGFGFSLYGLGGLIGVNREVRADRVRDAVRAGRLDSVLFPRDPVTNASQVLADLAGMFPPSDGAFVIGAMVKLGWGPGPLVTIEAGLIVQLPSPVKLAVMARIQLALPDRDNPIVQLRLDVLGMVDFGSGEISIDGALISSRVGVFALAGEMALRASWGASNTFALAAGGFHPRYAAPAGFPALRRLSISLADSENPRLRLETYLAITAGTVQVGANLEVYAATEILGRTVSAVAVLGFDALVRLRPRFSFTVTVYGSVTIAVDGDPWLSAAIVLSLSGPAPWHAHGEVRVKIGFLPEVGIGVEVTVGDPDSSDPVTVEVTPFIVEALARPEAVEALPVQPGPASVVLRQPAEAERAAHPSARVVVRERVVPLGIHLTRFGSGVVTDSGSYDLDVLLDGADHTNDGDVRDTFSTPQFRAVAPEQLVGRPEFESFRSGKIISADTATRGAGAYPVEDTFDDRVVNPAAEPSAGPRPTGPAPLRPPAGLPPLVPSVGLGRRVFDAVRLAIPALIDRIRRDRTVVTVPPAVAARWVEAAADRIVARSGTPDRFEPRYRPARLRVQPEAWIAAAPDTLAPLEGTAVVTAAAADEMVNHRRRQGRPAVTILLAEAQLP